MKFNAYKITCNTPKKAKLIASELRKEYGIKTARAHKNTVKMSTNEVNQKGLIPLNLMRSYLIDQKVFSTLKTVKHQTFSKVWYIR